MEYGPEIKRGSDAWPETDVRPVWLSDDTTGVQVWDALKRRGDSSGDVEGYYWSEISAIRLPSDHFANRAIEAGFTPCNGKPDDWDGGDVLMDDPVGTMPVSSDNQWAKHRANSMLGPIIGYHRKSTKQTVTIEMRTEDEWLDWTAARGAQRHSRGSIRFMELVRDLGLVTPPTPLERFMAEHPDADRRTAELVLGWSE